MGFPQEIKGHVDSLSRAINVPNAQANAAGIADVNPVFTWVRLAQRVPVRIHLDVIPESVRLVEGMTATVQVHPRGSSTEPKGWRSPPQRGWPRAACSMRSFERFHYGCQNRPVTQTAS